MINILIPEETPSLNKGEAAILSGMLETFKLFDDDVNVSMFSLDIETDAPRYGSSVKILNARGIMPASIMFKSRGAYSKFFEYLSFISKHFLFLLMHIIMGNKVTKLMKRDIWKYYCQADVIIMAHDSSFTPLYHCPLIFLFKWIKKIVVIYSATIPPINRINSSAKSRIYHHLIKFALSRTDLITLREERSYNYLTKLVGDNVPVCLTGDLAFLLTPAPLKRIDEIMKKEGIVDSNPIIGIAVSRNKVNFAFPDIKEYTNKEKKFIKIMKHVIDYLTEEVKAAVVFISHSVIEDQERDDRILTQKLFQIAKNQLKIKMIMNEYTPEELRGLTGKFEFCLGTRLHFIVDSVSMLVPSIMIANRNDYRTHGIFGDILGQEQWIYDVENLNHTNLIKMVEKAWNSREKIKAELHSTIESVKKKTFENGILLKELVVSGNLKH